MRIAVCIHPFFNEERYQVLFKIVQQLVNLSGVDTVALISTSATLVVDNEQFTIEGPFSLAS